MESNNPINEDLILSFDPQLNFYDYEPEMTSPDDVTDDVTNAPEQSWLELLAQLPITVDQTGNLIDG